MDGKCITFIRWLVEYKFYSLKMNCIFSSETKLKHQWDRMHFICRGFT